jgi:hypothetical protein
LKAVGSGEGAVGKDGEKEQGDAAMIFKCFFLLCLCVSFNIQNQDNK